MNATEMTLVSESAALTAAVARFVQGLEYADLPRRIVERMKVYSLDCIACGFAGAPQPWAAMVRDLVQEAGGAAEASCFCTHRRTTVAQAALVNGVMIGGFESEHIGYNAHPSGTVFPAAFAIAEVGHKSGREFLTALAAGYELVCRLGDAQTNAVEIERGFHNPAVNGPYGAAAAVGKLLHFDDGRLLNTLGIAGSHGAGLVEYAWHGEMTKRLHLGRAAQWGVESALLAAKGFTGPATILEGPYGFFHAYSPRPKPERLLDGLGERWLLEDLTIKAFPCHATCQAIVGAIQDLKATAALDPQAVTRFTIRAGHETLQERFLNRAPESLMGAQYSVPFSAAMAVSRDLDDPANYNESALADAAVRDLASRIEFILDESPRFEPRGAAELEITAAGVTHTGAAFGFHGAPSDPLDFAGAAAKFRRFTRSILSEREQSELIDRVDRLERLSKVRPLAKRLRDPWAERLKR